MTGTALEADGPRLSSTEYKVGEPTVSGDEATVPLTTSMTMGGQPRNDKLDIKLKNFGGIWKIAKDNKGIVLDPDVGLQGLNGMGGG